MKAAALDALRQARTAKRPFVIVTALEGGDQSWGGDAGTLQGALTLTPAEMDAVGRRLRDDSSGVDAPDGRELFIQVWAPPLRLVLVGAVHIAQPLSAIARATGYDVVVIDPRGAFATKDRFPGVTLSDDWPDEAVEALNPDSRTAIVTLTHDPKLDDPALDAALKSEAFYVGALGSRRTHAKRVERLRAMGFDDEAIGRIAAPVGLDIGAATPAEIAVAIMAQVTAALRRGTPPGADRRPAEGPAAPARAVA